MHKLTAVCAVLFAAATALAAAPPRDDVDVHPDWLRKPGPGELLAVWPAAALQRGQSGEAAIRCKVDTRGLLFACVVAEEKPAGAGFGAAALLLAPRFQMSPGMKDGKAVVSEVTIPVRFGTYGPAAASGVRMAQGLIWSEAPTWSEVRAATETHGPIGHVVLLCPVRPSGTLGRCDRATGKPALYADRARSLARRFRLDLTGVEPAMLKKLWVSLSFTFDPAGGPVSERILTRFDWRMRPDPDEAAKLYPAKAADARVHTGRTVMDCVADADGALKQCKTLSEDPAGLGFGNAAMQLVPVLAVNRWTEQGEPVEGAHVQFALRFVHKETDGPAPAETSRDQNK